MDTCMLGHVQSGLMQEACMQDLHTDASDPNCMQAACQQVVEEEEGMVQVYMQTDVQK